MIIDEGKFYRTREGRKVGPMAPVPADWEYRSTFVWTDGDRDGSPAWTADGRYHDSRDFESHHDLVAEWTDESTGPVRTVTRKEIVAGRYGLIDVHHGERNLYVTMRPLGCVREYITDFREAAAHLTAIADALDEQAGAK